MKIIDSFIEKILTVSGFIYGLCRPVYVVNELKEEDRPENHTFLDNDHNSSAGGSDFRLISWNILRYYHQKKIDAGLQEFIGKYDSDVIFIQEAPVYHGHRFFDSSIFDGFNGFYAPLHQIKKQNGFYNFKQTGNLILSKYGFLKNQVYELPTVSDWFSKIYKNNWIVKRIVVYVQIDVAGKKVGLYNVHLENNAGPVGRLKQLQYLVSEIVNKNNDNVIVIAGDFNTILTRFFESGLKYLTKQGFTNLFADKKLRYLPRLDYCFIKGTSAKSSKIKAKGSDHQPISIDIKIK